MSDLIERLRLDYCSCTEGYKLRDLTDPHCESCSTKDERHEAADEIERLRRELAEARDDIERLLAERDEARAKTYAADQPSEAP